MELKCAVQNYDWGKLGAESMVAKLLKSAHPTEEIDESKPYAELWVGTHPNGPSRIIERDVLLSEYFKDNEDAIGPTVKRKFGVQMPFMLKVLSIRKALSIQVHPDKKLAERLHCENPEVYKDPNHKPELAVALTPFEVLCGFRPLTQIREFIDKIPELRGLVSDSSLQQIQAVAAGDSHTEEEVLRCIFGDIMGATKENIEASLETFIQRVEKEDADVKRALQWAVVRRLRAQHGADAGCWGPALLHYLLLAPGQAIFLAPNVPHAYLSGECVEVMAGSDNVLRCGLTPKPRDLPALLRTLDCRPRTAEHLLLRPALIDENCCEWTPPVADFKLIKIVVPPGGECISPGCAGPGAALVARGAGGAADTGPLRLRPGTALFVKANRQLALTADSDEALHLYLATTNLP